MAGDFEETTADVEIFEQRIKQDQERIRKNQAYVDFLKANPLFQEFLRLQREAH